MPFIHPSRRVATSLLASSLALLGAACGGSGDPAPSDDGGDTVAEAAADQPGGAALDPLAADPADAAADTGAARPGDVLATVDDETITQADVDERIARIVASQMGSQPPPQQMAQFRQMMGDQVLTELIDEHLLDEDLEAAGIEPSDAEYRAAFEQEIELFLASEGLERAEFEQRVQAAEGGTFEEYLDEGAGDEHFRRGFRHMRGLSEHYPEQTSFSEEELRERYEAEKEEVWTREPEVRARHILIEVPESPPEAAEEARAEAERVLELARAEDADFAALAREHSDGPSGPNGGELGWFPREGAMVEPFAAAAFELEVGEVSDLVETQFGLHVIQVTDRREERVVPFEEARPLIERSLLNERLTELRAQRLEELREDAEIERS